MTEAEYNTLQSRRNILKIGGTALAGATGLAGCLEDDEYEHPRFGQVPSYTEPHYNDARDTILNAFDEAAIAVEKELEENSEKYEILNNLDVALARTGDHDERYWLNLEFDANQDFSRYSGTGNIERERIGNRAAEQYEDMINLASRTARTELMQSDVELSEGIGDRQPRPFRVRARFNGTDNHRLRASRGFGNQDLPFDDLNTRVQPLEEESGFWPFQIF